jgi:hypothetical protein
MFPVLYVGIHPELSPVPAVPAVQPKADPVAMVAEFLAESTFDVDGRTIPFSEFRKRFNSWSGVNLSPYRISKSLPPRHAAGAGNANKTFITNASWTRDAPSTPLAVHKGRIRKVEPCKAS